MQPRVARTGDTITTKQRRPRRSWGKIARQRSGRYQAGYTGPDLARHHAPATFTSRMDAEHWLASERRLIERDEWSPPAHRSATQHRRGTPFSDYATGWLDQRNLKPRTRHEYTALINGPLAALGKVPLHLITPERVRTWHSGLPAKTPTHNSRAYGLLHAVLNTAVGDGLIGSNPAAIRGAMNTIPKHQATILTPDEVAKVALAIQPGSLKALVLISAWCGLRWGEVSALTRADVSTDCSVITVARAVTHTKGKCHVATTKSDRVRTVIVPPHVVPDLVDHLAHHVGPKSDALLFPGARGCHLRQPVIREYFNKALKSAGITKPVRIHDLRHFAGTQTARVGNVVETMQRLGHTTIKASLIYQQVVSGRDREIAEQLSALAKPAQTAQSAG
ncbi:phage integrase family protein [Mycobacterium europaeum]|uniref:Phage integrase family protein n=1 Tax=Mycobacterium europaeum TaxID=761804 RepID=A0A0U1D983_9MYCO|nr:site-specific integrase [Mycobacterium europaeum]CQD10677.1 phage integrase family protein [Mycobacterium europaeum]